MFYDVLYHDEWHIQILELLIAMHEGKVTGSSMIYISDQDSKILPYLHVRTCENDLYQSV